MLPNEYSQLYDWSPSARPSYGDFLRAKQFQDSTRLAIDNHHKELIATNQQLSEHGFEVLSVNLERECTMLSRGVGYATDAGQDANPVIAGRLNWGFSEVLISQGQMNIPLDELIKSTKTTANTWAYEQFDKARDEFHRQLYPAALQSVTQAIEGLGGNPGIKTEFRFHFLMGTIRLGSYGNSSSEVINPQLAQQAYLTAAQYAQSLHPADAGLALICAGRAALVEGNLEQAIAHTRKGLNFLPAHAAGIYLLGRALFLKGERKEAVDRLAEAIVLNVEHALHASGDPGFITKMGFLEDVLRLALERYEASYRQVAARFRRAAQTLLDYSFDEVPLAALQLSGLAEIKKISAAAEALAATKTLFAYRDGTDRLLDGFRLFPMCFAEFKAHCTRQLQEKILHPPRREDFPHSDSTEESTSGHSADKLWLVAGAVSGILAFIGQNSQTPKSYHREMLESFSDLFLIPLIYAVGIAAVVALLENLYREYRRSMKKSALAAYEAAWYAYSNLKTSMEKEMAAIRSMSLPKECSLPPLQNTAKQDKPAGKAAERKRSSAWSNI